MPQGRHSTAVSVADIASCCCTFHSHSSVPVGKIPLHHGVTMEGYEGYTHTYSSITICIVCVKSEVNKHVLCAYICVCYVQHVSMCVVYRTCMYVCIAV